MQVYTARGSTLTSYYFVGGSYEVQGSGATATRRYYSFGGQSVGMYDSVTASLEYFLTDHLGSIVAVTNASGGVLSQQRYFPFGEVRDIPTDSLPVISQTDLGYTSQRNLDAQGSTYSLGLMDYKARMYDPYLNRFTQPDSIIPNGNPQSLNRYSYVNNSPVNFVDPTGHMRTESECGYDRQLCSGDNIYPAIPSDPTTSAADALSKAKDILAVAGVEISGNGWYDENIIDAANAVFATGWALMGAGAGDSWNIAFKNTFGPVRFIWGETFNGGHFGTNETDQKAWASCYYVNAGCSPGYRDGKMNIMFNNHFGSGLYFATIITHELGHTFSYTYGLGTVDGSTYALGKKWENKADNILYGDPSPSTYRHASDISPNEIFADMFTAWVFGAWNPLQKNISSVDDASRAMTSDMSEWLR
jgi:RHS repeat-associated protein